MGTGAGGGKGQVLESIPEGVPRAWWLVTGRSLLSLGNINNTGPDVESL